MKGTRLLASAGLMLAFSINGFAAKGDGGERHKGKPVQVA